MFLLRFNASVKTISINIVKNRPKIQCLLFPQILIKSPRLNWNILPKTHPYKKEYLLGNHNLPLLIFGIPAPENP